MRAVLALALVAVALASPTRGQDLRPYSQESFGTTALVPNGWQRLPRDARWEGTRFVSPDGQSWLAVYGAPRTENRIEDHMRAVARAAGEKITYLARGRRWLAVSGYKGGRIFYRKAILACGGRVWHHVALEYPAQKKRAFDPLVTRVSHSLEAGEAGPRCG